MTTPTAAAARALVATAEYDMSVTADARASLILARASAITGPARAYLLPLPEEQSADELRLASEHWSLERRQCDPCSAAPPVSTLLSTHRGRSEYRGPASAVVPGLLWNDKRRGGDPLSTAGVARRFAKFLQAECDARVRARLALTLVPHSPMSTGAVPRLTGPDGPLGRYVRAPGDVPDDPRRRFDDFYRDDPFEMEAPWAADGLLSDIDPATYAMYRPLAQQVSARTPAPGHALRGPTRDIPRPGEIPKLSRDYFQAFHMPPRLGDRLCSSGESCLFNMDPVHGHVGREFRLPPSTLPREDPAPLPGPPGPCINCLLAATRAAYDRNIKEGVAPALSINTFTVMVGEKDYGAHCLLPFEVDQRRTGISGPYPRWDGGLRSWQLVPPAWAVHFQLPPNGRHTHFWAETNMDFRQASVASMPVLPSPSPAPSSADKTGTSSSRAPSAPQ